MPSDFGFHNIIENDGVGLAVTGMSIVFTALALISGFIAALPGTLSRLKGILPPEVVRHGPAPDDTDEALAVAIGYALHSRARPREKTPAPKA